MASCSYNNYHTFRIWCIVHAYKWTFGNGAIGYIYLGYQTHISTKWQWIFYVNIIAEDILHWQMSALPWMQAILIDVKLISSKTKQCPNNSLHNDCVGVRCQDLGTHTHYFLWVCGTPGWGIRLAQSVLLQHTQMPTHARHIKPTRDSWPCLRSVWGVLSEDYGQILEEYEGGSSKMNRTYSPYDVKYDVNGGKLRNAYVVYFSILKQW
jgi:hypothetical protein